MNKTYLILLSSLIACSSRGMDAPNTGEPSAPKSYVLKYENSLQDFALNCVQKNIHQAVKRDVELLKTSNQLTPANVAKNIKNEIDLLGLPEYFSAKVLAAYKQSDRWGSNWDWNNRILLDHQDERHSGNMMMKGRAEECKTEQVIFCNANSDASQVAVIADSLAWTNNNFLYGIRYPPQRIGRLLYLWQEDTDDESKKWSKKMQAKLDPTAEDVVWSSSDNELCVASSNAIMVLARSKPEEDFKVLHTIPITRFRNQDLDILKVWEGNTKMDKIWQSFGRFAWNQDTQELVVETERNLVDKKSRLAILQLIDGVVKNRQNIEIPISSAWGINAIDWKSDGKLEIYDLNKQQRRMVVSLWNIHENVYELAAELVVSYDKLMDLLKDTQLVVQSENGSSYTLSRTQKNSIRSTLLNWDNCGFSWGKNLIMAIREHPEVGLRSVGTGVSGHSLDRYGYVVGNKYSSLQAILNCLCQKDCDEEHMHDE